MTKCDNCGKEHVPNQHLWIDLRFPSHTISLVFCSFTCYGEKRKQIEEAAQ